MAELTVIDSDILISHIRGHSGATEWLLEARQQGPLHISIMSIVEITGGMRSAERGQVRGLLAALHAQPVTEAIARRAGEHMRTYRASHQGISASDYVIAATAESSDARLATLNVKHFPMFAGLRPPFKM